MLWATQVPVHGHFLANLAGPFVVAGAGTAFAFIPISIAALAGVSEHQAGLASGLLNTCQQLGGAIGTAIASTAAASQTQALLHAGPAVPAAFTGGFQSAFWVLGAIALLALPALFALVRRTSSPTRWPRPRPRAAARARRRELTHLAPTSAKEKQRSANCQTRPRSWSARPAALAVGSPPRDAEQCTTTPPTPNQESTMRHTMVTYTVKPGREEENAALVRAVFEELGQTRPEGLRYAVF